ncbi:MAG: START domain-containing protein [Myxococcales bacterium]
MVSMALLLTILSGASGDAESAGWQTHQSGRITIASRPRAGAEGRAYRVVAVLDAPAKALEAVLMDAASFKNFMPHVVESRILERKDDGGFFSYSRMEFPLFVTSRDMAVEVFVDSRVDDAGTFVQRWVATPEKVPERSHVVRIRHNEGSWRIRPEGEDRSRIEYEFSVDPAGSLPSFAVRFANKGGITGTLEALEKEARRRAGIAR